jgi:hypothetical protein
MDFLPFVLARILRSLRGVVFFSFVVMLWEVAALIVMSGSLDVFLKSLGDRLLFMAIFFNGLYAFPIVLFIAIAYAVSQFLNGRTRLLAFFGIVLCRLCWPDLLFHEFFDKLAAASRERVRCISRLSYLMRFRSVSGATYFSATQTVRVGK